ncbi:cytochrome c oxidase accessory protein CcoG [bacterium]|nr:cytochrome c oxidase accessory protein CcoG [bacterium]
MNDTPNPFQLPENRLASTEASGKRHYIYPARVKGPIHNFRWVLHLGFILFFLILPWIKINNQQVLLLDIVHRRFSIFGLTFWAHEAPILFLVFAGFILGIGLLTALYGRVWCGWACPQTVFVETLFRRIENWIEGAGISQRRFNKRALSINKVLRKGFKWIIFLVVSLMITHSFLAYFIGSDRLLQIIQRPPSQNFTAFTVILFSTAIILFDFGWFREQFCIIACPYGRLQSVMMNEDSKLILYDSNRGEPRNKNPSSNPGSGDCIDCFRCVAVCPTGIDIRRGVQMECIMCTACVDACNTVMKKTNKPKGLISYQSENTLLNNKKNTDRSRALIYSGLILIIALALTYLVQTRNMVPVHVKRLANPPYTTTASHWVRNQFNLTVRNQQFNDIYVEFSLPQELRHSANLIIPNQTLRIKSGTSRVYSVFIEFNPDLLNIGQQIITLTKNVHHQNTSYSEPQEITLIGPR